MSSNRRKGGNKTKGKDPSSHALFEQTHGADSDMEHYIDDIDSSDDDSEAEESKSALESLKERAGTSKYDPPPLKPLEKHEGPLADEPPTASRSRSAVPWEPAPTRNTRTASDPRLGIKGSPPTPKSPVRSFLGSHPLRKSKGPAGPSSRAQGSSSSASTPTNKNSDSDSPRGDVSSSSSGSRTPTTPSSRNPKK